MSAVDEAGTLVSERLGTPPADGVGAQGDAGGQRPRGLRPAHALDRPRWTRTDTAVLIGLVVVGVALPAAVALWSHAFGIARFDDWAYRRILSDFIRTGHLSLVGWGAMSLVGQILWATPFAVILGGQPWVAGLSVAVASAIGIACAYWLARAVVGRVWGAACTLLVLAAPGLLVNTSTFMTDLPAFAADMACLALGVAALRSEGRARWALIFVSMAVGCAGFSVREFDLAAPVAVLVALAVQDRRQLRIYGLIGVCLLVVCLGVYLWTWHLPGAQHEDLDLPTASALRALAGGYFALALFVSPFLTAVAWRSRPSWRTASRRGLAVAVAIFVIGVVVLLTGKSIFSGNYLTQQGMSGAATLAGFRPLLFPGPLWLLLQLVGLVAGVVLAFVAANATSGISRSWSNSLAGERGLIRIFVLLCSAGLVAYGLFVQGPIFDRYVWPLAFGTAVLLAATAIDAEALAPVRTEGGTARNRPALAATGVLALVVTAVAAAVTLNADAYDGARWSAGQVAVKAGFRPSTVDAGFDWVGNYAGTQALRGHQTAATVPFETWYDQLFPGFKDCAFVSGSRVAARGVFLMRSVKYEELGFAFPEHLFVYAVRRPSCVPTLREGAS